MGIKIDKISEKIKSALVNPELNKVRKEVRTALKEMKESPKNNNIVAGLLDRGLKGLRADLEELGIPPNQWEQYEQAYKERFQTATAGLETETVLQSPEALHLDIFINDYAHYTKLDKIIAECKKKDSRDPLKKLMQIARANAPLLAGLSAGFMKWLNAAKEEKEKEVKNKPSKLEAAAAKADEVLKKGNKKVNKKDGRQSTAIENPVIKGSVRPVQSIDTKTETTGSVKYEIPQGRAERLSPEKFRKKYLSTKDRKQRNMFVLRQVTAGNANNIFEKLKITGKEGMTVEMEVDRTGLRVAGMDVQLDGPTAMAAAQISGCTLPTPWISDQIYKAAKKNKGTIPFIAAPQIARALNINWRGMSKSDRDTKRMSPEFAVKRAELLKKWQKDHPALKNKLIAGYFKDIVQPVPGRTKAGQLEIYGGHFASGERVQPLSGGFHGPSYSDYSHQLRRVRRKVQVTENGKSKTMTLAEFYANQKYRKAFGISDSMPKPGQTAYLTLELQTFIKKNKKVPSKATAKANKQKKKKTA